MASMCAWCAEGDGNLLIAWVIRYGALHVEHHAVKLERKGPASRSPTASSRAAADGPTSRAEA